MPLHTNEAFTECLAPANDFTFNQKTPSDSPVFTYSPCPPQIKCMHIRCLTDDCRRVVFIVSSKRAVKLKFLVKPSPLHTQSSWTGILQIPAVPNCVPSLQLHVQWYLDTMREVKTEDSGDRENKCMLLLTSIDTVEDSFQGMFTPTYVHVSGFNQDNHPWACP